MKLIKLIAKIFLLSILASPFSNKFRTKNKVKNSPAFINSYTNAIETIYERPHSSKGQVNNEHEITINLTSEENLENLIYWLRWV
jgi:hypothetical protein